MKTWKCQFLQYETFTAVRFEKGRISCDSCLCLVFVFCPESLFHLFLTCSKVHLLFSGALNIGQVIE